MLVFGFSAGLPFSLLVGTLNAWLGEAHVDLATIGVLSWIGLAYAFKFLWSPLVDRVRLPGLERLGDRKSTRLNSSHANISYAVFCLKKKISPRRRVRSDASPGCGNSRHDRL